MLCPQALGVLLWCISWVDLFYSFHGLVHGSSPAPVFFITPLLVGITMVSVGPGMLCGEASGGLWGMLPPWALKKRVDRHMAVVRGRNDPKNVWAHKKGLEQA